MEMNNIKYLLLAIVLHLVSNHTKAQSSNFSQYHLTPVYTSPGELGTTDYFQVLSHYRKQSLSEDQGYRNIAVSGIYPLYSKDNGRRFGGIGIGIMSEASGMNGILKEISVKAGYAYNWQLNTSHHISLGLQGGYHRRNIDLNEVRTESQYQNGAYDPSLFIGENFSDNVSQAFKVDAGATWYVLNEYGNQIFSLGVAAFNVNQAGYEFLEGSRKQPIAVRYQFHGSVKAFEKDRLHVFPTFRYMVEKNYDQLNLGANFLYQLQKDEGTVQESHVGIGAWYSLDNAAIVSLELIQPSYIISLSYDIPVSSDVDYINVNNGVEVTIGWRLDRSKKRKSM